MTLFIIESSLYIVVVMTLHVGNLQSV